jgi:hypothetical protein
MNYVRLVEELRKLAEGYVESSKNCGDIPAMQELFNKNSEVLVIAADAIDQLLTRLVKQACHFETIEAQDDE